MNKKFWGAGIGLIVVSYLQGILISALYSDTYLVFFSVSVLVAILYYLLSINLLKIIINLKSKRSPKTEGYKDSNVLSQLERIWGLILKDYTIKVYSGENSSGAFTTPLSRTKEILIGEKLKEKLNAEEIIFVISHEVAHHNVGSKKYSYFGILFLVIYPIPCIIFAELLIYLNIENIYISFATTGVLFILGVVIWNYSSCKNEFMADILAVRKTKDKVNAISSLRKIAETLEEKKVNKLVHLLTNDHPSIEDRILKINAEKV